MKPLESGISFVGKIYNYAFECLNIGIFLFSIFTFDNFRKFSTALSCQIYYHKIISNIAFIILLMSAGAIQMLPNLRLFFPRSFSCGVINFINT